MEKKQYRKCRFIHRDSEQYPKRSEGMFHTWGITNQESNDGNIMWSVALVEDNTGHIWEVETCNITFTEPITE